MGLDQYLKGNKFVSKHFKNEHYESLINHPILQDVPKEDNPSITIEWTMFYWRKANAIHQWFVDNVQGGKDDCRSYDVDRDQLESLLSILKEIEKDHSKAAELLPTQDGFFFGGTEYDEYYFDEIARTIEGLEHILKCEEQQDFYMTYRSSW